MYHSYPYTDFHEANMDWFLNKFKSLLEEWAEMGVKFDTLSDAVDALKIYVSEYFDNLNVQEEVNNKLDEMAQNGELDILIRGCEFLEEMNIHPLGFYSNGLQPQGSVYYTFNNVNYLAIAFSAEDETEDIIVSLNMSDYSIAHQISGNFGHCNGMTYYNGRLYIARGGGSATYSNVIDVIDCDSFARLDSIITNNQIYAISENNGSFYCLGSLASKSVYVYDSNFNYLDTIQIDYTGANSWQGMHVDDDYIYIANYRGSAGNGVDGIGVYFKNGRSKSFIKARTNIEIEDISLYGRNFITTAYTGGGCLILSTQLYDNAGSVGRLRAQHPNKIPTSDNSLVLYMNKTYEKIRQDGTQTRPFNNYTALIQSCLYDYYTTITIHITGDFSDVNITLPELSKCRSFHLIGDSEAKLGSLFVGGGYNVLVDNIEFVGVASDNRGAVSIRNCHLLMDGCTINSNNVGVYCESGHLTLTNMSFINCTTGIVTIRNSMLNIGQNITYTNVGAKQLANTPILVRYNTIAGFGDSIMAGTHNTDDLLKCISERTGWKYNNYAQSGGRYWANVLGVLPQIQRANGDFDCGIIICGTNDYNGGTITNENNFRTYVTNAFNYINENLSDKPILVCTPFKRSDVTEANTFGLTLKNYVDILLEIGEAKSIMMYDCYNDPSMNFCNNTILCEDGLHPLDPGIKRVYPTLMNKLL